MTKNDVVLVLEDYDTIKISFTSQPTTEDIAYNRRRSTRFIIQLIGGRFHVYDSRTIRREGFGWVCGLPVFVHDNYNAALMYARMQI